MEILLTVLALCVGNPSVGFSQRASNANPDSKVHGAYMGPIWGRQDRGGPHVGSMNFAIWEVSIFFVVLALIAVEQIIELPVILDATTLMLSNCKEDPYCLRDVWGVLY